MKIFLSLLFFGNDAEKNGRRKLERGFLNAQETGINELNGTFYDNTIVVGKLYNREHRFLVSRDNCCRFTSCFYNIKSFF